MINLCGHRVLYTLIVVNSVIYMTDYVHTCMFFGYIVMCMCSVRSPITKGYVITLDFREFSSVLVG